MLAGRNPVSLSGRIDLEDVCLCAKERLLPVVHHNTQMKSSLRILKIYECVCLLCLNIFCSEIYSTFLKSKDLTREGRNVVDKIHHVVDYHTFA